MYSSEQWEDIKLQFPYSEMPYALDLARADERGNKAAIPYQLCPKCNGQGQVTKPPYTPGDVNEWVSSSIIFQCDVCNGSKIIPMFQPTPPKQ